MVEVGTAEATAAGVAVGGGLAAGAARVEVVVDWVAVAVDLGVAATATVVKEMVAAVAVMVKEMAVAAAMEAEVKVTSVAAHESRKPALDRWPHRLCSCCHSHT